MPNISDSIEKFILASMENSDFVEISRNSLAEYFACAPSQINYVLDTRFTVDRGFTKESRRGGSGFIKIIKIKTLDENAYLRSLILDSVGDELTQKRMIQICEKLQSDGLLTKKENDIILTALSDESLSMPFAILGKVRAKAFKNILVKLIND